MASIDTTKTWKPTQSATCVFTMLPGMTRSDVPRTQRTQPERPSSTPAWGLPDTYYYKSVAGRRNTTTERPATCTFPPAGV
jgi:hypothetical protein